MMLVMVWLLPVPGGPTMTRLRPAFAERIARTWLESASWTANVCPGSAASIAACPPGGSGGGAGRGA